MARTRFTARAALGSHLDWRYAREVLDSDAATGRVAVLVDFDNVVAGAVPDPPQMMSLMSRIVGIALDLWPATERIEVSLFGGWLEDGVLARRGSAVQASVAASPFFPLAHPSRTGLLRGAVVRRHSR